MVSGGWRGERRCRQLISFSHSKLNEDGSPGHALPITSEKDIFDFLDEPYVAPEDR